jgi:glycosyltransferase involved in cell wall biosynthesis
MTVPKKHIAIIIPGGIGTGKDNAGVPVLEQTIQLLAERFEVTVFQLHKTNNDYKATSFRLIDVAQGSSVRKFWILFFLFRKLHRRQPFDAVHAFWAMPCGFFAVLLGKSFKIKSLISLQGGDAIALPEINYGQLLRPVHRRLILWSLHRCTHLLCPTKFMYDNLVRFGLQRKLVEFIPLGVDSSVFTFRIKEISNPCRFLHIGNFNRVKDQETLLRAFQLIANQTPALLTIIGEGELENDLRLLADKLQLSEKVTFLKPVAHHQLPSVYHANDILLHTSLSEGHPIVAEEAMACGVSVCGTAVGLLYDLPDCCVSVPVKEHKALASGVISLINDKAKMYSQRSAAQQWANKHSMSWTVKKIAELYGA